jgi:uncharacterized protein involved in exopolysaccharide biosynthesis
MKKVSAIEILLRLLLILVMRKKLIIGIAGIVTIISIILVLIVQPTYRSVATLKPPGDKGMGSLPFLKNIPTQLEGFMGSFIGGEGLNATDYCFVILSSSKFASIVIKRFDLEEVYEFKKRRKYYFADVLKAFDKNFYFEETDEGAIALAFRDEDPKRAKEVVEYMVFALDSLYIYLHKEAITQNLKFIDQRVENAKNEMEAYEDTLIEFQKKNNLYLPDIQIQTSLENVAKMEAQLQLTDEKLRLENDLRGKSPKYNELLTQKRLLRRLLRKKFTNQLDTTSLILPMNIMPDLAIIYFRLEQAYEIKLMLYKFLVKQVEMLKIEAEKNIKQITVVDPPWINNKKVSPPRRLIVQITFVLSFMASALLAVVLTYLSKYKEEEKETYRIITDIKKNIFKFR